MCSEHDAPAQEAAYLHALQSLLNEFPRR